MPGDNDSRRNSGSSGGSGSSTEDWVDVSSTRKSSASERMAAPKRPITFSDSIDITHADPDYLKEAEQGFITEQTKKDVNYIQIGDEPVPLKNSKIETSKFYEDAQRILETGSIELRVRKDDAKVDEDGQPVEYEQRIPVDQNVVQDNPEMLPMLIEIFFAKLEAECTIDRKDKDRMDLIKRAFLSISQEMGVAVSRATYLAFNAPDSANIASLKNPKLTDFVIEAVVHEGRFVRFEVKSRYYADDIVVHKVSKDTATTSYDFTPQTESSTASNKGRQRACKGETVAVVTLPEVVKTDSVANFLITKITAEVTPDALQDTQIQRFLLDQQNLEAPAPEDDDDISSTPSLSTLESSRAPSPEPQTKASSWPGYPTSSTESETPADLILDLPMDGALMKQIVLEHGSEYAGQQVNAFDVKYADQYKRYKLQQGEEPSLVAGAKQMPILVKDLTRFVGTTSKIESLNMMVNIDGQPQNFTVPKLNDESQATEHRAQAHASLHSFLQTVLDACTAESDERKNAICAVILGCGQTDLSTLAATFEQMIQPVGDPRNFTTQSEKRAYNLVANIEGGKFLGLRIEAGINITGFEDHGSKDDPNPDSSKIRTITDTANPGTPIAELDMVAFIDMEDVNKDLKVISKTQQAVIVIESVKAKVTPTTWQNYKINPQVFGQQDVAKMVAANIAQPLAGAPIPPPKKSNFSPKAFAFRAANLFGLRRTASATNVSSSTAYSGSVAAHSASSSRTSSSSSSSAEKKREQEATATATAQFAKVPLNNALGTLRSAVSIIAEREYDARMAAEKAAKEAAKAAQDPAIAKKDSAILQKYETEISQPTTLARGAADKNATQPNIRATVRPGNEV